MRPPEVAAKYWITAKKVAGKKGKHGKGAEMKGIVIEQIEKKIDRKGCVEGEAAGKQARKMEKKYFRKGTH